MVLLITSDYELLSYSELMCDLKIRFENYYVEFCIVTKPAHTPAKKFSSLGELPNS